MKSQVNTLPNNGLSLVIDMNESERNRLETALRHHNTRQKIGLTLSEFVLDLMEAGMSILDIKTAVKVIREGNRTNTILRADKND